MHPDGIVPDDDTEEHILTELYGSWDELPVEPVWVDNEITPARAPTVASAIIDPWSYEGQVTAARPARILRPDSADRPWADDDVLLASLVGVSLATAIAGAAIAAVLTLQILT